jgi:amino acid transporter
MNSELRSNSELKKAIKAHHYFSLAFGSIIGVGWIMVLGDWLEIAGPLGAILGFAIGTLVIVIVGLCYAELASILPVTGGEVAYVYEIFGLKASYAIGWYLCLPYVAVTSFEAISIGWIVGIIFPATRGKALYTIAGEQIYTGSLLLGIAGMAILTFLIYTGLKSAAVFQEIFTYALLILSLIFICAGIFWGSTANLTPVFSKVGVFPVFGGIMIIFMAVPNWLAGFNIIPQTMEEKAPGISERKVVRMIILSIFIAGFFYMLVILSSSMAAPWKSLLPLDLPVAGAFEAAFRSPLLAKFVLLAGLCGMITTWNVVFIASTRILFAMGRARIMPQVFSRIHPRFGSPTFAVIFVGIIGTLGALLGRGAILPIVNANSNCFAAAFFFTCLGVIKLRQRRPDALRPYRIPGGNVIPSIGILFCVFLFFLTLYQPYKLADNRFPMEWAFIIFWVFLGVLFWAFTRKVRTSISESERRKLILAGIDLGKKPRLKRIPPDEEGRKDL